MLALEEGGGSVIVRVVNTIDILMIYGPFFAFTF